mgnify:CR=1 FL=1
MTRRNYIIAEFLTQYYSALLSYNRSESANIILAIIDNDKENVTLHKIVLLEVFSSNDFAFFNDFQNIIEEL